MRCSRSRPTLAKFSPSERSGASRLKNRPILAESAPSERIPPSCPATSARRGGRRFARGRRLLSASGETPVQRLDGGWACPFAPAHLAEPASPASPESFIRCEFRQNRLVFCLGGGETVHSARKSPERGRFPSALPEFLTGSPPKPSMGRQGIFGCGV